MKSPKVLSITLLLLLVASSLPAVAGVVNLTYISSDGNSYNGVATYPYYLTVDGNPDSLMCIGYNEHVTNGETWQAMTYSVASYGALIGDVTKADQLAYLFTLAHADGGANSDVNAVAWNINKGVPALTPGAQALYDLVIGMGSYPGIDGVVFYVPTNNQNGWTDGVHRHFSGQLQSQARC